jgi:hypothetical protein
MAKIVTQTIAITVSKLVKDDSVPVDFVSRDLVQQLEEVVGELVSKDAVVEASLLAD